MRPDRTAKKRRDFLARLSEVGNVSHACLHARIPRRTAYDWRAQDPEFAAAWDAALDVGIDALEDEAMRRALEGTDEPVFYKGEECGAIRRYSDTLTIFLLKAHRPDKYKDRAAIDHTVDLSLADRLTAARERVRSDDLKVYAGVDQTFHDLKAPLGDDAGG